MDNRKGCWRIQASAPFPSKCVRLNIPLRVMAIVGAAVGSHYANCCLDATLEVIIPRRIQVPLIMLEASRMRQTTVCRDPHTLN